MYWNWDTAVQHIVFQSWSVESPAGLFLSCVAVASICLLSQIIAGLRLRSESRAINTRRRLIADIVAARTATAQQSAGVRVPGQPTQHVRNLERQQAELSKRPMAGSLLFGVQSLLSAVIMLVLMTFNGFLIGSCAVGSAIGYHYFGKADDTLCH